MPLFVPQSIERALVPHDQEQMNDLYQSIREHNRRRQMLHEDSVILMSSTVSEGAGMGQDRAIHVVDADDTTPQCHRFA